MITAQWASFSLRHLCKPSRASETALSFSVTSSTIASLYFSPLRVSSDEIWRYLGIKLQLKTAGYQDWRLRFAHILQKRFIGFPGIDLSGPCGDGLQDTGNEYCVYKAVQKKQQVWAFLAALVIVRFLSFSAFAAICSSVISFLSLRFFLSLPFFLFLFFFVVSPSSAPFSLCWSSELSSLILFFFFFFDLSFLFFLSSFLLFLPFLPLFFFFLSCACMQKKR